MKRGIRAIFPVILLCVLFGVSAMVPTEEYEIPEEGPIDQPYPYPPRENALGTADAQRDALWIPEDILERMTTRALVETVLGDGYLTQFTAYDNGLIAMMMFEETYNIYPEMVARPDYYEALVELYKEAHELTEEEYREDLPSEKIFYVTNLETLLAIQIYKNERAGVSTPEKEKLDEEVRENCARINQERAGQERFSGWSSGFYWFYTMQPSDDRPQLLAELVADM